MLIPVIKGLWSTDLPNGPPGLPKTPRNCIILLSVDIGLKNESEEDTFDFTVITEEYINNYLKENNGIFFGRGLIIVEEFDWELIERRISKLISGITGDDWKDIAVQISRYGYWEFEDYKE